MENEPSQTVTRSSSISTMATPASKAAGKVSAIPEALLTTMEAVQTNQFNTDPPGYAKVARDIINEILQQYII